MPTTSTEPNSFSASARAITTTRAARGVVVGASTPPPATNGTSNIAKKSAEVHRASAKNGCEVRRAAGSIAALPPVIIAWRSALLRAQQRLGVERASSARAARSPGA